VNAFLAARDFLLRHRADYETAYRDFRWPQMEQFNWALDYFDVMARDNHATALWIVEESGAETKISFADLAARSNSAANFLRAAGVRRGDRVLVMLGNETALWESLLAAFKLGAVVIPSTGLLGADDLRDRFARGAVRHAIASAALTGKFAAVDADFTKISVGGEPSGWCDLSHCSRESTDFTPDAPTSAADPLLLYFTSGTTSKPKLVLHTHQSYPVGHLSTMYWIGAQPGDVHWNISSPGWAKHAFSSFFAPWNAAATVFAHNYARFRPADALRMLAEKPITTICAPPTVWRMIVQEPIAEYSVNLREALSAGEPLNPEVIEQVERAWGITIRDAYGQTETTVLACNSPGQPVKPGSMGRPAPGYRLELSDIGEICVEIEGAMGLMPGYAGDDTRNSEVMCEGFYHTGDIGTRDQDGHLMYIGRSDDVFKASDYRISPFELESALVEHPSVAEAAVVPCLDPIRGFVPKAFVIPATGCAACDELARDLFAFLRNRLAPYKRIRRLEFAELPKTISGKIRRAELRRFGPAEERGAREYREEEFTRTDRHD
jgi:acetyl-CoA synthetase